MQILHLWVDISPSVRKCPSTGYLPVVVVIRRTFCGAVELEDGVDADFPDSLRDRCRLGAESDLALAFVGAQFALDSNVRTLGEIGGELSQLPEGDASMPLGRRFPAPDAVLPRRFRGEPRNRRWTSTWKRGEYGVTLGLTLYAACRHV